MDHLEAVLKNMHVNEISVLLIIIGQSAANPLKMMRSERREEAE
jgi:hypothetical protein